MDRGLDRKADIKTIRKLYQDGLLTEKAFLAASHQLRPPSAWVDWARRMLLFFGSALILAGIIFFFAYNWARMGRFFKFILVEAGIGACIIALYLRGLERLSSKVLLLSASVLVGVLLAVYGQTYQTGADAFELFIGWAVLILGWVLISEFQALWVVWLILLNTGAVLYWKQVGHPNYSLAYESLCMALAFLNGIALVLREVGAQFGIEWLRGRWVRSLLVAAALIALSVPTIHVIIDPANIGLTKVIAAGAWGAAVVIGYVCFRFLLHDMIPLAITVSNVCLILLTFIGKVLFHGARGEEGLFLIFSLIILAVVSGAIFLLREIAAKMAKETGRVGED